MTNRFEIMFVAGARPNFMKIAPVMRSLRTRIEGPDLGHGAATVTLVHTGQHYDNNMSEVFFNDLGIPEPDYYLDVGSASHSVQTAWIMIEFEKVISANKPDLVVVVGDVNSTIACSLTAKKLGISVAHIEAGLRSFDMEMPEEINRKLTDAISDLLFVTEESGIRNLMAEGVEDEKIHFVGNVMIDTLNSNLARITDKAYSPCERVGKMVSENPTYAVVTLHRPSNVDDENTLRDIWHSLETISMDLPIIFPVHPRTLKRIDDIGLTSDKILFTDPLGYLDMLYAVKGATLVLTDSGGLQEETTVLGIPCLTIRHNTERPCTIEIGTNHLVGTDPELIVSTARGILAGSKKKWEIPPLWDGRASDRIVDIIIKNFFDG